MIQDNADLIRRCVTIRQSRIKSASLFDARQDNWYILGDLPPNYPMPAIRDPLLIADNEPLPVWRRFAAIGFYGTLFS